MRTIGPDQSREGSSGANRKLMQSQSKCLALPFSGVGSLLLTDITGVSAGASEIAPLELIEVMGRDS